MNFGPKRGPQVCHVAAKHRLLQLLYRGIKLLDCFGCLNPRAGLAAGSEGRVGSGVLGVQRS